jgi:hypothetical protein
MSGCVRANDLLSGSAGGIGAIYRGNGKHRAFRRAMTAELRAIVTQARRSGMPSEVRVRVQSRTTVKRRLLEVGILKNVHEKAA